ncbi:hypothetical protein [Actinokineospora sp. NBRC 105648]|uniref:hypothetical protein n=1 Tax=Actinokineospora sp. NBRC 105648 TaxID=3032206 RepID=UPI002556544D|nr:hypothetical protein [Actinokineospora sp. NBRC 105648]
MKTRIPAVIALAATAALVSVAPASATRPQQVTLWPPTVSSGQSVTVTIYCFPPAQQTPLATTVDSRGFLAPIPLHYTGNGGTGFGWEVQGTGRTVRTPGRYTVSYDCWSGRVSTELVVTA